MRGFFLKSRVRRDMLTHLVTTTLALERATQVVDHDIGSPRGEEQRVCSAQSSASACHDDSLAIIA